MGARGLTRAALGAVALAVALAGAGCGDDDDGSGDEAFREHATSVQAAGDARAAKIQAWVEEGRLPPVALELLRPDGTIDFAIVDGPNGDQDIVRSSPDGGSGPPLRWDLDGDGEKETNITERELYDATLGS